jgi:hypothetical protein
LRIAKQIAQQIILNEQLEAPHGMAALEQLQQLVEQARRWNVVEQAAERSDRFSRLRRQREVELRREPHGAQHAHGIFAITLFGIADQPQRARTHVAHTVDVIPNAEVRDVVVERVDGEIAPPNILADRSVDVVAQNAAAIGVRAVIVVRIDHIRGAKRRDLDDVAAEAYVREPEPTADQAAITK